jgi:hypothetical protein
MRCRHFTISVKCFKNWLETSFEQNSNSCDVVGIKVTAPIKSDAELDISTNSLKTLISRKVDLHFPGTGIVYLSYKTFLRKLIPNRNNVECLTLSVTSTLV